MNASLLQVFFSCDCHNEALLDDPFPYSPLKLLGGSFGTDSGQQTQSHALDLAVEQHFQIPLDPGTLFAGYGHTSKHDTWPCYTVQVS